MYLRILLGVACLSLMTASKAEAQLFRRFRAPRTAQPQRPYTPPAGYSQNGYQGRLTATPRTQPMFVRRPDGSVVRYYPNNNVQARTQSPQRVQVPQPPQPKIATTVGELQPVRPAQQQRQIQSRASRTYQQATAERAARQTAVAPVGISLTNETTSEPTVSSISPATPMPQASTVDPASSIPVNTAAANPAPTGLSLTSLTEDVVPASAEIPVETPSADPESGQKTFSVLESIE